MRKSKNILFSIAVVFMGVCICYNVACILLVNNIAKNVQGRQGIILPKNMKVLYHHDGRGWDGFGEVYTVFKLKKEPPVTFLNFFEGYNPYDSKVLFEDAFEVFIEIPEMFRPNWELEYKSKSMVGLMNFTARNCINRSVALFIGFAVAYFSETKILYCFEIFNG